MWPLPLQAEDKIDRLSKAQIKLFFRFLRLLFPYRRRWIIILILSGAGTLLGLVNPYLTKLVIDKGLTQRDLKAFVILALLGAAIFILNGVIDGLRQFLDRYIKRRISFDLSKRVFKHLQGLSFSYFADKSSAEHLFRVNNDVDRVAGFITSTPPEAVIIFPKLLFVLGIVFYLNWKMALFSLFLSPFLYVPVYYFARRMREVWRLTLEQSEVIFKSLQEIFSHIYLVKVFAKEASSVRDYLKKLIARIRIEIKNIKLEIFSGFTSSAINRIIIGLITFYGGYQVIKGEMTLGTLAAIMVYLGQLIGLQGSFAHFFLSVATGLVSCQRVAEVLDKQASVVEAAGAKNVKFLKGEIVFKGVSFGYRAGEPVFNKLNFIIEGQRHIAFAGVSGCGKTTLLNLILRLYEPQEGSILIDGHKIEELSFDSLRGQMGMALQEPFLLNDTITMNIAYGINSTRNKISHQTESAEIARIAGLCGIDELVPNLPRGYETVIGENACKISEGEKQRIAIARALIRSPKILILDEAMSSLDSAGEGKILENIKQEQRQITIISVSHRLSAVMKAELVYFLSRAGGVITGSARELLENNKEFRDLFAGQMKE